jgi:hypothetical protein
MPSSYTWPLASPPSPTPVAEEAVVSLAATGGRPLRGLLTPFRRGANDFTSGEGQQLMSSKIREVLGTRCSGPTTQGELPWRTDFGSLIEHARWRNNDAVLEPLLDRWARDAIARWLPSIRITGSKIRREKDPNGHETIAVLIVGWEALSRGGQVLGKGSTSVPLTAIGRV